MYNNINAPIQYGDCCVCLIGTHYIYIYIYYTVPSHAYIILYVCRCIFSVTYVVCRETDNKGS